MNVWSNSQVINRMELSDSQIALNSMGSQLETHLYSFLVDSIFDSPLRLRDIKGLDRNEIPKCQSL